VTIKLASPELGDEERDAIARVLASGMLVQGREVAELERAVAERCERAHAIAVSSGTAALELALRALGVAGGEVIVPTLTWPSPAHAAIVAGARVATIDVDRGDWNGAPDGFARARTAATRAAIAIDQLGVPARHPEIARALGDVPVIEDAACAIGSTLGGRPCGSFGIVSCLSFHPRKVITTGEGGMCLTDDAALAAELRALRNHGQSAPGTFIVAAPNLRLTEMQAAMGIAQLARLPSILERRRALAERYRDALLALDPAIRAQSCPPGATRNEQTFGLVLPEPVDRDRVITSLAAAGIEAGRLSYTLHAIGSMRDQRSEPAPVADAIVARGIALPLHTGIGEREVDRVIAALAAALS
jgi:dTDP-4-amino-4,6-dideoxygalactose transaminase